MNVMLNMAIFIIIISTCLYTISYGRWTWQNKNKLGAIMIFAVAATVIALPLYALYFKT